MKLLLRRAELANDGDFDELGKINDAHNGLAETIAWVCEQDIDPVQVVSFRESAKGREVGAQASKEALARFGTDTMGLRTYIQGAMAQAIAAERQDYLDTQFPKRNDRTNAPLLSERDVLIMGKDSELAIRKSVGPADSSLAPVIAKAFADGNRDNRWVVAEQLTTQDYWESAISLAFQDALPSYSELTDPVLLQDKITPWQAVQAAQNAGKSRPFDSVNPVVRYIEDGDADALAHVEKLGRDNTNSILVMSDNEGEPMIATPWTLTHSNYVMVTAPDKGFEVVHVDPTASAEERLDQYRQSATNLTRGVPLSWTQDRITKLHEKWQSLDTEDKDTLSSELDSIQREIHKLAAGVSAPRHANAEEKAIIRSLAKLAMFAGDEQSNNVALRFQVPRGLGTQPENQIPSAQVVREDNHNDTCNIYWFSLNECGEVNTIPYRELTNIANESASAQISNASFDNKETIGIRQPGLHGMTTYGSAGNGTPVFIGHWMSGNERLAMTMHSPASLTHQSGKNSALFDIGASAQRSPDNTEMTKRAVVELIHGTSISEHHAELARHTAAYTGEYLLAFSNELGSSEQTAIQITPDVFSIATDEELKAIISQKIALSDLPAAQCMALIDRVQETSWSMAKEQTETSMTASSNPETEKSLTI